MQHRILIGINTQVGKTMLIFRPALKNECRSEENYSWSAKPAITINGECLKNIVYVGETETMLKDRIQNHLSDIRTCKKYDNKGNNKITELRTILQRESQNS